MLLVAKGIYRVRLARDAADLARAQGLRHVSFLARRGLRGQAGVDSDGFDATCLHVLVETLADGQLVCCYRLLDLPSAARIDQSYSAQFYDLSRLAGYSGPLLEMGRFCLHPDWHDPDILRLAWAALTRLVDDNGVKLLFGCSSFAGSDPAPHQDALALLHAHLAPPRWMPGRKSPANRVIELAGVAGEPSAGLRAMPSLLRTYLAMGGWVSDHAVIDPALDTLHVFTAVEIDRIPPARARLLRAIAQ